MILCRVEKSFSKFYLIILEVYVDGKVFNFLSFIDNFVYNGHKTWLELDIQNGNLFS